MTSVTFNAHEAEISGRRVITFRLLKQDRLRSRDAHVRTRSAPRGRDRGRRNDEPVYRYRVDGVEKAWCDDARLVLVAAFAPQRAFPSAVRVTEATEPTEPVEPSRSRNRKSGTASWGAVIELTGTADGVPTYLSLKAENIVVDYDSGEIDFKPGGHLDVIERHGSLERSFRMDDNDKSYEGFRQLRGEAPLAEGHPPRETPIPGQRDRHLHSLSTFASISADSESRPFRSANRRPKLGSWNKTPRRSSSWRVWSGLPRKLRTPAFIEDNAQRPEPALGASLDRRDMIWLASSLEASRSCCSAMRALLAANEAGLRPTRMRGCSVTFAPRR
jgi:hypothetical protein